jgi:protein-disulfide isomerase
VLAAVACDSRTNGHGPPASASAPLTSAAAEQREPCETLKARLCSKFGATNRACVIAASECAQYGAERCATMLTRFDAVAAELGRLAEGAETLSLREQTLVHGDAPSIGAHDARVLLVEFSDFECGDCRQASLMVNAIRSEYANRVRLVFRQYPKPEHEHARLAAEASLAANAQGKFWEYHDVLFGNPHDLSRPALERYAETIGLDMLAFRRALDGKTFAADVDADIELGHMVYAGALPALYANGKRVSAPFGAPEFAALVTSAEAAAH